MIDIDEILRAMPRFETYCSVEKLHAQVETLRAGAGNFEVYTVGTSVNGVPIHHVRFGKGSVKALFVGGPHAMEPIGSLTVSSLLSLLEKGTPSLLDADVEWHIVPCIDPDATMLNEGWSQKPFTFDSYLRNFYLQPWPEQIDFSFPVSHKKLAFDRPSREAKILQGIFDRVRPGFLAPQWASPRLPGIFDRVRPDFFFTLHNAGPMGGSWFYMSQNIGDASFWQLRALLEQHDVALQEESVLGIVQYAPGMRHMPTMRGYYDYLEAQGVAIPDELTTGKVGASSAEYLEGINPKAFSFVAELSYGQHPSEVSDRETSLDLRQIYLRLSADNKYLAATILEEWDRLHRELDATSPFYRKIASELVPIRDRLHDGVTEWYEQSTSALLFNPAYAKIATERDSVQALWFQQLFLCNAYAFVRLLKASTPSPAVQQAIVRLDKAFDEVIAETGKYLDMSAYRATDCNALARVQLGSGLIALNMLLTRSNDGHMLEKPSTSAAAQSRA